MEIYHSNELYDKIERVIRDSNIKFWNFMGQPLHAIVETEIRYNKLYDIICEKYVQYKKFLDITNPTESVDTNDYLDTMGKLGVATQCKLLMEEEDISKEQIENIEKAFCKIFDVHYYEETGEYL